MRSLARLALSVALLGATACGDSTAPSAVPTTIRFKQTSYSLDEGGSLALGGEVSVLDAKGREVKGVVLTWSSNNRDAVSIDASGLLSAQAPGDVRVTASGGASDGQLKGYTQVQIRAVPVALALSSGDGQRVMAGATLRSPVAVRVLDRRGNAIGGAEVSFAAANGGSVVPATGTTDVAGIARATWTLGPRPGEQFVEARAATIAAPVSFRATAVAPEDMPNVEAISPDTLRPGATITLTGRNFGGSAVADTLFVAGTRMSIVSSTPTQIVATLPAADLFPCVVTGPVEVLVRTGGLEAARAQPAAVARQRSLAVGQVLTMTTDEARCNEFAATGGRYVVSVFNTSTAAIALGVFRLRGVGGTAAQAAANQARQAAPSLAPAPLGAEPAALRRARQRFDGHRAQLARDHEVLRAARIAARAARRRTPSQLRQNQVTEKTYAAGDTMRLRVQGRTTVSTVTARVVYAGEKALVLEDRAAPLAGTMDEDYRAFGAEFERDMLPIIETNFGNPLAVDAYLGGTGRVLMLFTPRVNEHPGVLGFVTACDMLPSDAGCAAQSNRAAIFFGIVPTVAGAGTAAGTRKDWFRQMRPTVIHEVKHITSNAEHLLPYLSGQSNDIWLEDLWLEEASAMISEEIWARGVFGYRQNGNTGYDASVYCEVRALSGNFPECDGKPYVMTSHFDFFADYLRRAEQLSPFVTWDDGRDEGGHFYGSGWAFLRWAADHSGMPESEFFRALNLEKKLDGLDNVVARMGRPFSELMTEWSLALILDDYAPAAPFGVRYSLPSWNLRDIYRGFNRDFPNDYAAPYPLAVVQYGFGAFERASSVRGGSSAYFELSGAQSGPQVLELARAAPTLRMSVARVQ